jgi:hypothetical protein
MWRVVTGMTNNPIAQASTALSPEWDRGFDEAFTELISSDPDLVRAEFDALIGAGFSEKPAEPPAEPPAPPAPPAPSAARPAPPQRPKPEPPAATPPQTIEHQASAASINPRPPP